MIANSTAAVVVHTGPAVRVAPAFHPAIPKPAPAHPNPGSVLVAPPSAPPVEHAAAAHPATVQVAAGVVSVNPAVLIWTQSNGGGMGMAGLLPRNSFALPDLISPATNPTDQTLLEEPQDPAKKHFVPSYEIATNGRERLVSLEPVGPSYQLVVQLRENTAPALSTGNIRVEAETRYLLTANLQQQIHTWDFSKATTDGAALKLTLAIPDLGMRDLIYQAMTDPAASAKLIVRRLVPAGVLSPVMSPPGVGRPKPAQLFSKTSAVIDTVIPFLFSKDLDGNIFAKLHGMGGAAAASWNIVTIPWNSRSYPYYQSSADPTKIGFLPDAFQIARNDVAPRAPKLSVSTNGEDMDSIALTLSYTAQPVWSADRIADAVSQLRRQLDPSETPSLALFNAEKTALALKLPPEDPAAPITLLPQTGATIDFGAAIKGSVTLKLAQFQRVYDALFDGNTQLLSGEVSVMVDEDVQKIPFSALASDFVGAIFETAITTVKSDDATHITCVLTNAIESPIHIDRLSAALTDKDKPVTNVVEQVSPPLPVDLVPLAQGKPPDPAKPSSLTLTIQLPPGASVDPANVLFNLAYTRVIPDPKAIWKAIMKTQVVGPVMRPITVNLFTGVFATPDASDGMLGVQVVFENGRTVSFNAPPAGSTEKFLSQKVSIAIPIEQYILHEEDTGAYRYRMDTISSKGKIVKGDWIADNADTLWLSVD